jgi:Ca-activated chloride channel family protein
MTSTVPSPVPAAPCGGHLVTLDGRTLPLRATRVVARAAGGIAAVRLEQTFANPFAEPLQLRYLLPLPADAAVAGFVFHVGDRRVEGRIEARGRARERFEQALLEGRTAGLLEQQRSALFAQELGNVPPGAEVVAVIDVDQPLAWHDGSWEWRFPTAVAPRYLAGEGRVADAAAVDVPIADGALPAQVTVELAIDDELRGEATSPSHPLVALPGGARRTLAIGPVAPDRDVVVRWPVAAASPGVSLRVARPAADAPHAVDAYALLTVVPPRRDAALPSTPRDLTVLLDVSGSMSGAPLDAARHVVGELVRSLGDADRLELTAFASRPTPWLGAPCAATAANKATALRWLAALRASGGTEMRARSCTRCSRCARTRSARSCWSPTATSASSTRSSARSCRRCPRRRACTSSASARRRTVR